MSVAISILAYGTEHIEEFRDLINKIHKPPVFVYTDSDDIEESCNVIPITSQEPFNYNLKRNAIDFAFRENDVVVMMDTDIRFDYEYDFTNLTDIEEGLHVYWMGSVQNYKDKKISITQVLNNKTGIDEINSYGEKLITCGATIDNITFFDEFIFVLKISDASKKKDFIETWKTIDNQTKMSQPKDRHNNELNGALESLIISLSCNMNGIKIINNSEKVKRLFDAVVHYGSIKHIKNLI